MRPHVNVQLVQLEKAFFAYRALMGLHPLVPEKVIDQLIADHKQLVADCALMCGVLDVTLRVPDDLGEVWKSL